MLIDDFTVARNEDIARSYAVKRGGQPVSLAGCSLYMQARAKDSPSDVLVMTSGSDGTVASEGISVTDADGGLFEVAVSLAAYRRAPSGEYDYDIVLVDGLGRRTRIVKGVITLEGGVTVVEELTAPPGDPGGSGGI